MNLIDFGLVPHGLDRKGETREGIVLVGRSLGIPQLHIHLGVGDIIEKIYRQPIYRNILDYRQIIDIEFWEFGNYRKIIDIENCIQFYPINTIESIVLKTD